MLRHKIENRSPNSGTASSTGPRKSVFSFLWSGSADHHKPELTYSNPPLFRVEKCAENYSHLLKKKDVINVGPIINYFVKNSEQAAFLAGDVVNNHYMYGKRKYSRITILVILTTLDMEKYSGILNNIISSNDGAFSMGFKYWVRKNRGESCFKDDAQGRYIVEPRLEGIERLLFPLRPTAIELDLITKNRFYAAFGIDIRSQV